MHLSITTLFYTYHYHTHVNGVDRRAETGSSAKAPLTLACQREAELTHASYLATAAGFSSEPTWLQHGANKAACRQVSQRTRSGAPIRGRLRLFTLGSSSSSSATFVVMHCDVQVNTSEYIMINNNQRKPAQPAVKVPRSATHSDIRHPTQTGWR